MKIFNQYADLILIMENSYSIDFIKAKISLTEFSKNVKLFHSGESALFYMSKKQNPAFLIIAEARIFDASLVQNFKIGQYPHIALTPLVLFCYDNGYLKEFEPVKYLIQDAFLMDDYFEAIAINIIDIARVWHYNPQLNN